MHGTRQEKETQHNKHKNKTQEGGQEKTDTIQNEFRDETIVCLKEERGKRTKRTGKSKEEGGGAEEGGRDYATKSMPEYLYWVRFVQFT